MIEERFFQDRDSLFDALTQDCSERLETAIDNRGAASFLVSGGGTPKPLYQRLAGCDLPWAKTSIALVDERWVDVGEQGSNETFIREHLLQDRAAVATYIPSKTGDASPEAGLAECEQAYHTLPRPFDLVILGMGPDGHTASLFPHAGGLTSALDPHSGQLCAAIQAQPSAVTGPLTERITLSLCGLLQARQLHLLITGDDKLQVYRAAKDNTDFAAMPVSAILHQEQVPVWVYWSP